MCIWRYIGRYREGMAICIETYVGGIYGMIIGVWVSMSVIRGVGGIYR